jgi:serine phosphatase RsbU (regulator of sigma subunit)/anti-sigma regulatory factor (Ser/Thr protein kinase)
MTFIESLRRTVRLGPGSNETEAATEVSETLSATEDRTIEATPAVNEAEPVEIAPDDPLLAVLQSASAPVDIRELTLRSPALDELREDGIQLVVPLVAQGELIGALYLGPRLSEQDYSVDDRHLLTSLAGRAAPAIRVAQLVQTQASEAAERERLEQEMRVATMIQQQFLPHSLPDLPDWQVAAYYGPARAVGGDFYDFIELPDGRIGVVVGDVTDKGVPAALVMARTHSILRAEAPRLVEPGAVLKKTNELLCQEMPANMFVTCLYGVLDTASGSFRFANAGHNLPYSRTDSGVDEFRATGMPLGLLPDMEYEEAEGQVEPGGSLLLYSDGFVEAHAEDGEMYGFPRLREAFATEAYGSDLVDKLLDDLHAFTGPDWEQEDDLSLVTLRRSAGVNALAVEPTPTSSERVLLDVEIPGALGNERAAMEQVADAVAGLDLAPDRLERLKTAVSEAAMNAIEHGSGGDRDVPIHVQVTSSDSKLRVRVADMGLGGEVPLGSAEIPDIEAKLKGEQKPRGWGLFLIEAMVDEVTVEQTEHGQAVVLTLNTEGDA